MDNKESKKITNFSKIISKKNNFVQKIKEKYKSSEELKSFFGMVGDILIFGVLSFLVYLALFPGDITFTDSLIKILGFGSGLWLIIFQIVPSICQILSSLKFVGPNNTENK